MTFVVVTERAIPHGRLSQGVSSSALHECDVCPVRHLSICSALAGADHRQFAAVGRSVSYSRGAVLFAQGSDAGAVYNVTDGAVRLCGLLPNGHRYVVGFALPGDFLGLPRNDGYSCTADALGRVTACRFPRRAFLSFLEQRPLMLRRVLDATTDSLDLAREQMMLLGLGGARMKVAAFLLALQARWARLQPASAILPLPMLRQDIGEYVGLSIATVSRKLRQLAREGTIAIVPKGVRILSRHELERIAGL